MVPPRLAQGKTVVRIGRRKALALFAYLVTTQQPQARDRLLALLWPEYDAASARSNLRRTLSILRKHVGTDLIEADRSQVEFVDSANLWCDIHQFRTQCSLPHQHEASLCSACLQALTAAVDLYTADFIHGFSLPDAPEFNEWAFFERESLQQQLGATLHTLIQHHASVNEYDTAIQYAQRKLTPDPLHEPSQRLLMELYARSGQQASALRQYERCVQILQEELGVEPEEETTALWVAIRQKQDKVVGGQQSRSDPQPVPNNLPKKVTPFIGRTTEQTALFNQLMKEETRLVTITGAGGMGKTRLSLAVGRQFIPPTDLSTNLPFFPDGIYFVELASLQTADLLPSTIAQTLTVRANQSEAQLHTFLRDKKMLLILDNFEHLLEGAASIARLLQAAPRLKLLVTSRERLRLHGEQLFPIMGLDALDETQSESAASALFLSSARRVTPNFDPSQTEREAIGHICQLVAGMPLALELAASWIDMLPPHEIADEIAQNLDFLSTELINLPERHRSILTVLEQSWKLLNATEQAVFCKLAIFRNGFTRQAGSRVTNTSLPVLAALMRKSIVIRNLNGRYTMHGLLQQYATAKLNENPDEANAIAEKHSRYYSLLLQTLEKDLLGTKHTATLAQIGQDIENIVNGWYWALTHTNQTTVIANVNRLNRYIEPLFQFYDIRSRFQEGYAAFQFAVEQLDVVSAEPEIQIALGRVFSRLGWFAFQIGQSTEAIAHLKNSIKLLRKHKAQNELIFSLNYIGAIYRHLAQYNEANQHLHESEQLCREQNNHFSLSVALNVLGQIAYLQQNYPQAQAYCEESLALKQAIGDRRGTTYSLLYLGLVARDQGDYAQARQLFETSMAISKEHGDRRAVAIGLGNLAEMEAVLGYPQKAEALYKQRLTIDRDIYNLVGIVTTHIQLGDLAQSQDNPTEATKQYAVALSKAEDLQTVPPTLAALLDRAKIIMA